MPDIPAPVTPAPSPFHVDGEDGFITAVRNDNGAKVRIPAHYMNDPILSRPFRLPPSVQEPDDTDGDEKSKPTTGSPTTPSTTKTKEA